MGCCNTEKIKEIEEKISKKYVKGLSIEDLEKISIERQLKGNEYGDTDLKRYQCLDALEEIADIRNILGNRLLNRLINDIGYVPKEVASITLSIYDTLEDLFYEIKKLDKMLPDKLKTDENGGDRILPDYLK